MYVCKIANLLASCHVSQQHRNQNTSYTVLALRKLNILLFFFVVVCCGRQSAGDIYMEVDFVVNNGTTTRNVVVSTICLVMTFKR